MKDLKHYRINAGSSVSLKDFATADDGGMEESDARAQFEQLKKRMEDLQEVIYAQCQHALLVVLQAMDTGGKDSTIRSVFTGFNPAGCRVANFKAPNESERLHDFLWRVHQRAPRLGQIVVFNRSHYEDVLIARVRELVPKARWKRRYKHINDFEEMLSDEGVHIVKFFLHISKDYQKRRLQKRLDNPSKHWKFDPGDLEERKRWDDYQSAYEKALARCSTERAPWYVIPAEIRWYRDLLIARALVETLESMDLRFPQSTIDPQSFVID